MMVGVKRELREVEKSVASVSAESRGVSPRQSPRKARAVARLGMGEALAAEGRTWSEIDTWTRPSARVAAMVSEADLRALRDQARGCCFSAAQTRLALRLLARHLFGGGRRMDRDWAFFAGRALGEANPGAVPFHFLRFAGKMSIEHDDADGARWVVDQVRQTASFPVDMFLAEMLRGSPLESEEMFDALFPGSERRRSPLAVRIAVNTRNAAIPERYLLEEDASRMGGSPQLEKPAPPRGSLSPGTLKGLKLLRRHWPRQARSPAVVEEVCRSFNVEVLRAVACKSNVRASHLRQAALRGVPAIVDVLADAAGPTVAREVITQAKQDAMRNATDASPWNAT